MTRRSLVDEAALRAAVRDVRVTEVQDLASTARGRAARIESRARRRRVASAVAVVALVVAGAVIGVHADRSSSGGQRVRTVPPASTTTVPSAPTFPPQPAVTLPAGTSAAAAASIVNQCAAIADQQGSSAAGRHLTHPALRALATDAAGQVAVVTTTDGWIECNVPNGGVATQSGSSIYQTWASTDGWDTPAEAEVGDPNDAEAPTDAPGFYLTAPIEGGSPGGGVVTGGWRDTISGRAAPDIARVTAVMPSGQTLSATVANGMFILDQLSPAQTTYGPTYVEDLRGYDAAGHLVYHVPDASTAAPACSVTSTGVAVTPRSTDGQPCQQAIAWG